MFDSLCASIPFTGLRCLTHAAALLAAQFPNVSARLEFPATPTSLTSPQLNKNFQLHFFADNGLDYFTLRLPQVEKMVFSINQTPTMSQSCMVKLVGRLQKDAVKSSSDGSENQLSTEIDALTEMFVIITEGIAKDIDFETPEAVPLQLAEGLLRTMQFLSPDIALEGVKVRFVLPGELDAAMYEIWAEKWKEPDVETATSETSSSIEASPEDQKTAHTPQDSGQRASDFHEDFTVDAMRSESGLDEVDTAREDWATGGEQDFKPFEPDIGTDITHSKDLGSRAVPELRHATTDETEL